MVQNRAPITSVFTSLPARVAPMSLARTGSTFGTSFLNRTNFVVRDYRRQLVRRGSLGQSALIPVGAQDFHLGA